MMMHANAMIAQLPATVLLHSNYTSIYNPSATIPTDITTIHTTISPMITLKIMTLMIGTTTKALPRFHAQR